MAAGMSPDAASATPNRAGAKSQGAWPVPTISDIARTCCDHLAGRLGVAIAKWLLADSSIVIEDESGQLTDQGVESLRNWLGLSRWQYVADPSEMLRGAARSTQSV